MNGDNMTAVILTMRDGTTQEQVFVSRYAAELFVYAIPFMALALPEGDDVASAIISPLVVEWSRGSD